MSVSSPSTSAHKQRVLRGACIVTLLVTVCVGSIAFGISPRSIAVPRVIRDALPFFDAPSETDAVMFNGATTGAGSAARAESKQMSLFNKSELRALWVDAFNPGIKSPQEVAQLIDDAHAAHVNAIFVQVRKRGDAYFNQSIEPRADDLKRAPDDYDPLAYVIAQAHAANPPIEVHAWLNAMPIAKASDPPTTAPHVFASHGTSAQGDENWLSKNVNSSFVSDNLHFLDPGHPQAAQYTSDVYLNLVKHYDVDGIHLDFIRYAGVQWGYNDVSVNRFNAQRGASGVPAPKDPRWMQWRRDQVTNVVRQIYLEAIALKPKIKVSAALITWGRGPVSDDDWHTSSAYSDVLQDWQAWLQEGTLDLAVPMNYDTDSKPQQQQWFDQWVAFEKAHYFDRQLAIGLGAFMNEHDGTSAQLQRALTPNSAGQSASGVSLFSYHQTSVHDLAYEKFARALTQSDNPSAASVFGDWARIPDMPWKTKAATGYLKGFVRLDDGHAADGYNIQLSGPANRTLVTSGTGFYGALNLPPGTYMVSVVRDGTTLVSANAAVAAGNVASADFTLGSD